MTHLKLVIVNIRHKDKISGHSIQSRGRRLGATLCLFFVGVFFAGTFHVFAALTDEILTNAADVISLPAEKAAHSLKVVVTGVVTASDPVLNGRFFVQDATSGVFVDNANGPHLAPGELVTVTGITYPGAYAPTITAPHVQAVGWRPLPTARSVSVEQLMSGTEDSQRIEISGIVRDARMEGSRLAIDLAAGGYRFRAFVTVPDGYSFEKLVGSQVRIRGTAAEAHNRSLRQLILVEVYIPVLADLMIQQTEPVDPFDKPVIALNNLAQYRAGNSLGQRVHVSGVVTLQKPGESLFLQDKNGGLQIQSRQPTICAPGELVEAVGFPSFENFLPVLQDAVFRKVETPAVPVQPRPVTIAELQNGLHNAEYVSLAAKLIERTVHEGNASKFSPPEMTTMLVLQGSNFTFTANADYAPDQSELADIPIGSVVRVSGVCQTEITSDGKLKSFQILMGSPGDIHILQKPGWLTPQRLLIGFLILSSALVVIVSWMVMLARKNSALNFLIGERENAQRALQQAHDLLEVRVKERTEQLKFEITARKESEVQFKAVLSERTRLAQELHDTVEQTLTGIALQLDTASKLHQRNPENSRHHLELARSLMAKSQVEVRQSIWDLRNRALEQFDLSNALAEGARQITSGTSIQIELKQRGKPHALPEVVEENLLRIGQEALANIIKHSHATSVNMELQFELRRVNLQIKDNGIGFERDQVAGPNEGHFGLLGMSERASRLGGRLVLLSLPGEGTTVRVEIPLNPSPEFPQPPDPAGTNLA